MNIYDNTVFEFSDNWWEELMKYQRKEPGIIDSTLLSNLVYNQGPKDQAGLLAREEGIDFEDILELRITYKNILTIANLWCFTNLVKLQLSNNWISKIEGLDHMVHLKWLDLSFNVIKEIENLHRLKNLKDLTFYHNQIITLENMDELKNLEILSIGRNEISQIENILYLRNFPNLKSVNFSHNPFTSNLDYRALTIVYIPQLVTIDYTLISEEERKYAAVKFENTITSLEAKDEVIQADAERKHREAAKLEFNKCLFVDAFAGNSLVEILYLVDEEESKLRSWWIINNLFTKYQQGLLVASKEIFKMGLNKYKQREEELRDFHLAAQEKIDIYNSKSQELIDEFLENKKLVWSKLGDMDDFEMLEAQAEFNERINYLFEDLIKIELTMVEVLDEIIKDLDSNLSEMVHDFRTSLTSRISSIREMTHRFYEDLFKEASLLAEKNRKPDEIDDIPADIFYLVADKMLLSVTIQTGHETRIAKIDNTQDDILARLANYVPKIIKDLNVHMEMKRNRKRVQEIKHFVRHYREEAKHLFEFFGNFE